MLKTKKPICLKYGDQGKDVETAQKQLQKAGSSIQVTGSFTIGMVTAVKAWQKKNGLEATGIIDQKTWDKLTAKPAAKKAGGAKK